MKKRLFALCCALLMALPALARAEGGRKLTLMVYMCGSNPESAYGSASADMREMMDAGFSRSEVSVLVMTGGSTAWSQGYDPAQCLIHELGPGRSRVVWSGDARDMGEGDTLRQLLRYGADNYPADEYALILWDHGCGPIEGVCLDELFSMDRLSLGELTGALQAAELPGKLRFIGFDACLMGSLEVACAVAPYAEYMIASQETEPATGWDYAFLRGIEADPDGAATGARVIEGYMATPVMPGEALTLSCLDLSQAPAAEAALGRFFAPYEERLDPAVFTDLSQLRASSVSYGSGVRGVENTGYDLVDLRDLCVRVDGGSGQADELTACLDQLVVACGSNKAGSSGLSVFHPMFNKDRYGEAWRESYHALGFCSDYVRYTEQFGELLLSDALADWSGMRMDLAGADDEGQVFTLALNDDQIAHFDTAELLILYSTDQTYDGKPLYSLMASVPATLDEDGILRAAYGGHSIYAVTDDGALRLGPVSYVSARDGSNVVFAIYTAMNETLMRNDQIVQYWLDPAYTGGEIPVDQIRVQDEATDSFTNRVAFTEEGYRQLELWDITRQLPEPDEMGLYPAFNSWGHTSQYTHAYGLPLPESWHFEYADEIQTSYRLWAVFQVTDTQQNTYCTAPIPVDNPNMGAVDVVGGPVEMDGWRYDLSAETTQAEGGALRLTLSADDLSDEDMYLKMESLTINGRRVVSTVGGFLYMNLNAGGSESLTISVSREQLQGLESVDSVDFELVKRPDSTAWEQEERFSAHFELTGCDVSALAPGEIPLARAEQDGVTVDLLALSTEFNVIRARLRVDNGTDAPWKMPGCLLVNDALQLDGTAIMQTESSGAVPPGREMIFDVLIIRAPVFDSFQLPLTSDDSTICNYVLTDPEEAWGLSDVTSLSLLMGTSILHDAPVTSILRLELAEPCPVPAEYRGVDYFMMQVQLLHEAAPRKVLAKSDQFELSCDALIVGQNGVALSAALTNRTAESVTVTLKDATLNGQPVRFEYYEQPVRVLGPGATMPTALIIGTEDDLTPGAPVGELRLTVCAGGEEAAITLRAPEGAALGEPEGLILTGDDLIAGDPAAFAAPTPSPEPDPTPTPKPTAQPFSIW